MAPNRRQAITWTNVDPDLCRHMASPGLNELTQGPKASAAIVLTWTLVQYGDAILPLPGSMGNPIVEITIDLTTVLSPQWNFPYQ